MEDPLTSWSRDAHGSHKSDRLDVSADRDEPEQFTSNLEPLDEPVSCAPETPSEEIQGAQAASAEASADGKDGGEAAAALRELVHSLEASGESGEQIDLEAPEPDWGFEEDSSAEISALNESLSSVGSPAARVDLVSESDVDVSPEEPDFEELAALDLDQHDIEPPEPQIDDDEGIVSAPAAPAVTESRNGTNHSTDSAVAGGARHTTRFKPVTEFAEILLETAEWPPDGRDDILAAAGMDRCDIVAPALSFISVPPEVAPGAGRSGTMSMAEASVDLEPEASLAIENENDLGAKLGPASTPFEPGGLFLDLTSSSEAMQPEPEGVSSGGGKPRS
ncbi:MAG: hypothetical protein R2748_28710 [Bryobacterales bacterium]